MMAIVKASFTRSRQVAKKAVRYISHRAGRDHQRVSRQLFGPDGAVDHLDAYQLIDQAEKGSVFFRFAISPDPSLEDGPRDLHLRQVTEDTMFALGQRAPSPPNWVAAVHDDHSEYRHVHVVVAMKGRLDRDDLQVVIQRATEACREQRHELDAGRQPVRQLQKENLEWEREV
jgi:hypothetical protein